jgi:hypothetical protein
VNGLAITLGYRRRRLTDELGPARSIVSAWLDNATIGADAVAAVVDRIAGGASATQATAGRRPTGNADRSMTFATNDSLSWPLGAGNNQNTTPGICFYMKQPVSALETIFAIYNGAGGASVRKLLVGTNTARRLVASAYISGNDGRQISTPVNSLPVAGTSCFARMSYDSAVGGDGCVTLAVNGTAIGSLTGANLGAGGTLGVLPTATGNAVIGDLADGVAVVPYNGTLGRYIFALSAAPNAAQEAWLMSMAPLV